MSGIVVGKNTRPIWEVKDDSGGGVPTQAPDVHGQVMQEIKAMGENTKKLIDSIATEQKALQKLIDEKTTKWDAMTEEKFQKLSESIMTKTEALEKMGKDSGKRMDELDVAFQRMAKGSGPGDSELEGKIHAAALEHKKTMFVLKGQYKADDEITVSSEEIKQYAGYERVFRKWMRTDEKMTARVFSADDLKLLTVGVDPDGGLLVPATVSSRIVEKVYEDDPIRRLASAETIGTDRVEIMEDLDEAGDGWETETQAQSETGTPRLNKVTIPVHWQSARPRATQQMLDDATRNMEQWLANKVASKFGRTEGAAFVTGTGIGRPRGFLTYDNGTSFNQVEQVNMGAAAALTTDGFINVLFSMIDPYSGRATWLMNRLAVRDTMKLKDGDGQYIWRPGLQPGVPASILGLPVVKSTTMPTVAANALSVALADWAEAYLIVDRMGITVQRDPYTAKPLVEFYTRRRVGGGVVNFDAIKIGKVAAA